ncbi:MAG: YitT family protein, partial [Lachnoanaerobaculum gingivalis]
MEESIKNNKNNIIKNDIKRFVVITLAAILMAVNIKTFVRTGDLFPGGATGITLLITRSARIFFNVKLPYTVVNIILNAIPVYI